MQVVELERRSPWKRRKMAPILSLQPKLLNPIQNYLELSLLRQRKVILFTLTYFQPKFRTYPRSSGCDTKTMIAWYKLFSQTACVTHFVYLFVYTRDNSLMPCSVRVPKRVLKVTLIFDLNISNFKKDKCKKMVPVM